MSLLQKLKQAFAKYAEGNIWTPVEVQRDFLDRLPAPKDDLERSYLQYRCQAFLMSPWKRLLMNGAAIPLLLLYQRKLAVDRREAPPPQAGKAVLLYGRSRNILPESLSKEFEIQQVVDFQEHLRLSEEDWQYLRMLRRRYPFAFFFRFKCMVKVAMYSHVLFEYAPQATICSEEYSFTSSLLTDYCQKRGVDHINVMHGDKLYFIRDSFFRFHRCYVCDQHYQQLFYDLRAASQQFRVESSPAMELEAVPCEIKYDAVYYLQFQNSSQIRALRPILRELTGSGMRIAVRPHPLYTDMSSLADALGEIEIEDYTTTSIERSLSQTKAAISCYSTVLLQAVNMGKEAVIDDVVFADEYKRLKKLRYIVMEKPHRLLSDFLAKTSTKQ